MEIGKRLDMNQLKKDANMPLRLPKPVSDRLDIPAGASRRNFLVTTKQRQMRIVAIALSPS